LENATQQNTDAHETTEYARVQYNTNHHKNERDKLTKYWRQCTANTSTKKSNLC